MDEEKIATFMSMTGTDQEFARSFLESAGGDINMAIDLLYGGGGVPPGVQNSSASSSKPSTSKPENSKVKEFAERHGVDLVTAQAMMDAQGEGEEEVRAPIAPSVGRLFGETTENTFAAVRQTTLMDFEHSYRAEEAKRRLEAKDSLGLSAPITSSHSQLQQQHTSNEEYAYDYDSDDSNSEYDEDVNAKPVPMTREKNLQNLFSPPVNLIFAGTFEEARRAAQTEEKWILVNIQKDTEFFSYVLNRDLWQSDVVRDVLGPSFIFFQRDSTDTEGARFLKLYKISNLPHISIINPRTGELVKELNLKSKATETDSGDLQLSFLDKVSSYLDINPMRKSASTSSAKPPTSTVPQSQTPPTPPVATSSETSAGNQLQSTTSGTVSISQVFPGLLPEPKPQSPGSGPIRIRLLDGRTVSRNFSGDSEVGQLFAYVCSLVPEAKDRPFDLTIPNPAMSLHEKMNETIASMGLLRSTLISKWL